MRGTTRLAVAALLAGGMLAPGLAQAQQGNPNAAQIIQSLMPNGNVGTTTRGIRMAGHPEAAQPASVRLNVLFATGSAKLTPKARQVLDQLGQALTAAQLDSYRFRIEGHTDTVGNPAMNQALSASRADSVVAYLEGKFNIASSRLQAIGMGERDLPVPTPDQTPEPRNRCVVVVNIGH